MEETLRRMLVGKGDRLVLQLGGGRRAAWRDWPVERYAELIRRCAQGLYPHIFVLGGEDQAERLAELDRFFGNDAKPYHNMVGKLSLAESAALLAGAQALVSTDTGIMHLGFAVGTRVVALIHCNNPGEPRRPLLLRKPPSRGATSATGELSNAGRCGHGRHFGRNRLLAAEGIQVRFRASKRRER